MSGPKYQEFAEKYVKTGGGLIVPKEKNPFKQMHTDTFRLENAPGFGGYGGSVDWSYIHEPVNMYPNLKVSEQVRHLTILGGDPVDYIKLHGEVEVTLGRSREDARTYKYGESVNVYVDKGMYYNINITKIDDPKYPIHFNEFINGDGAPVISAPAAATNIKDGYEAHITVGEEIWTKNQPHHEVIYPVVYVGSAQFGSSAPVRRTWMPVSDPHVLANKAHYHEYLEYIVFYGSDPDNIADLGGTVEFTIGENKDDLTVFTITESTIFYVKPGLWHSPMVFTEIKDVKKPIIFCEVSYAASFGPEAGNTVWIDGVPPSPPPAR